MARPVRRIIAGNNDSGNAVVLSDAPSPDVLLDPARPGYASTRLWVTDRTPARVKGIRETLNDIPHALEPPVGGTQCRFIELPPDAGRSTPKPAEISAWFERIASPHAKVSGPHPYMQRTRTTDLCYVLEGHPTLVLETEEVALRPGDVAIVNGTAHAWANRSDKPAIVIQSQHSGVDKAGAPPPRSTVDPASIPMPPAEITNRFRRVVTGVDGQGRSCLIANGGTPNIFRRPTGAWFYEVWTIDEMPTPLGGNQDRGCAGRTVMHSPPAAGTNWRISYGPASAPSSHATAQSDGRAQIMDTGGGTERKPNDASGMHRTPSVDYAICLQGDRKLVLPDSEVVLKKGDVVIQLGNWHTWAKASDTDNMMSYVMIGGEFG